LNTETTSGLLVPLAQHPQNFSLASERCGQLDLLQSDERPELRAWCSTSIFPVKCDVFRNGSFVTRKDTG
jgi:hypothetical protein